MQNNFINSLIVQQGLNSIIINNNSKQQLCILPQPVHVGVQILADGSMSASLDNQFQNFIDRLIWPPEPNKGWLIDQQIKQLPDILRKILFTENSRVDDTRVLLVFFVEEQLIEDIPVTFPHVSQEAVFTDKRPTALMTRPWFLLGVRQQVKFERRLYGEASVASGAFERLLSGVQHCMSHEVFFTGEWLAAVFTDEGLQFDVDVQLVHL